MDFRVASGEILEMVRREITATRIDSLNLWFCDLPVKELTTSTRIEFTFHWTESDRWEDRNETIYITPE